MSAFNTRINAPVCSIMSKQGRNQLRDELAQQMAEFEAQGGVVKSVPSVAEPLPLHSAPKKSQAMPARKKKERPQDTPQEHYFFKDQVVRVVVNDHGQAEFVLVDVADAIGAYRESFSTRFDKALKTQRKVITRGRVSVVSFSTVPEVLRVVASMISKKPSRRATFESFMRLVQTIDQEVKAKAVA